MPPPDHLRQTAGAVRVTDHAVLRWLERVEGLDIEALRARIADHGAVGAATQAPAVIVDGHRLIMGYAEGGPTVITVYAAGQRPAWPGDRHADR